MKIILTMKKLNALPQRYKGVVQLIYIALSSSHFFASTTTNAFVTTTTTASFPAIQRTFPLFSEATQSSSEELRDIANRQPPPQNFYELQSNSAKAAQLAIDDGQKLLEVEVRNQHLFSYYRLAFRK